MSKHTPGPWHVANGVQVRSSSDQIAKVWMMRKGEGKSNARLIASAPELLEALEASTLLLRTKRHACESTEVCRVLDTHIARNSAAIAKARGES